MTPFTDYKKKHIASIHMRRLLNRFFQSPSRESENKNFSLKSPLILICLLILLSASSLANTITDNKQLESHVTQYGYEIVNVYPHDPTAFTQGLIYLDGYLYESTGLNGRSSLRKVDLETGNILQKIDIDRKFFAEGLTNYDGYLLQLSWRAETGFIYNKKTFELEKTFNYTGEGWGLTTYGHQLIMSDGTSLLRFVDPVHFTEIKRIQASIDGKPLKNLNELEMVKGNIFANVWLTDRIVIISPETGHVNGIVNLAGLLDRNTPGSTANVLNGIAYDAERDRLFVTGKLWPTLFELRLVPSK